MEKILIFSIFSILSGLVLIYALLRNQQTYRQREAIRKKIFGPVEKRNPHWKSLLNGYDSVTYYKHFWALFWGESPIKLYPQSIWLLMQTE